VESRDVVVVEGLRKRYDRVVALDGVDLRVREAEIFGVLGPNGAGKSTLIKTLVGSTRPTSGTARVLGLDPHGQSGALRRQIGYMPQAPALYEDLSPRHNLEFFGRAHDGPDLAPRVDATLDLVGLRSRERDPVFNLSGGMKQRVSLACALLHQPRVLLLDEPTAGVDPKLREIFWQHFRALAAEGVTLLVSTHQMDEALLCDRLAVIRSGKVLVCETPRELLRRGRTRVAVHHDDIVENATLDDYSTALPRLLQRHRLDPAVSRIDLEHDTLDTIILSLIADADAESQKPGMPRTAEAPRRS
jgi:ABC-2 type transport system ATP-binding protein